MTSPVDPTGTEPRPEAVDASTTAPDATTPPPAEPPPAIPGWAPQPARSRRTTGCVVAAAIVVAVLFIGYIGLVFLGGQVESILRGTVEFGTGGSECSLTETGTSFATDETIHLAAHFERTTAAGETVTLIVTDQDGTTETNEQTFDAPSDCLFMDLGPGIPPGHYALEFRAGTELLASGELDITP
jgi:hypothetical protein